jgi:sulfur relay (sulfurtransferase) complex TusBCD TusD component (DsrE family)
MSDGVKAIYPGKKLGIMIGADPASRPFEHAIKLALAAAHKGAEVYLYFIDEAVRGLDSPAISPLQAEGIRMFGCAYSLQRRGLPLREDVTMAGLTMLNEIMAQTDRFLAFT